MIVKLREVELLCSQGNTIAGAARQAGMTEQTFYRWRKEYGGMNTADAKRMKELEKENARLKRLGADLSLDNAILRDVNTKTSKPGKTDVMEALADSMLGRGCPASIRSDNSPEFIARK